MKTYDMIAMLAFDKVTRDQVACVYSGKGGNACACGCKGNYRYAQQHREAAGKWRGYAVTDDEVNPAQVSKVFRVLRANPALIEQVQDGHFAAEIDGRLYMLMTAQAR